MANDSKVSNRWPVLSLAEWFEIETSAPPWIIRGFIPGDAITLISGPRKLANKTYSSFVMASAIASGKSLAGFEVSVPPSKVLFVEEEGSLAHTKARWQAVWSGLGLDEETIEQIKRNIVFSFRDGLRLNNAAWKKLLLDKAASEGAKVVFLDAFVYMIEGDENDTANQLEAVQTIQALRANGHAVVVLLHLNNQYGLDPKADIDSQIRGAGPIKDCYDQHLALRRYGGGDKFVKWILRSRDGEPEEYMAHWEFKSDALTKLTTFARLDLRKSFEDDDHVNIDLLLGYLDHDKIYTAKQLRDAWGFTPTKSKMVRELLLEEGALREVSGGFKVNKYEEPNHV